MVIAGSEPRVRRHCCNGPVTDTLVASSYDQTSNDMGRPMRRQEHLVFVYGTLLRGQPNHHFMKECRFVTAALTEPAFELVDLGPCPAMVLGGTQSISGEVYAVGREALEALDCL